MGLLYIASDALGTGGTAVSAALATFWRRAGVRVALCKPLALDQEDVRVDGASHAQGTGEDDAGFETQVLQGTVLDPAQADAIAARVQQFAQGHDVVLVDGLPLNQPNGTPLEAASTLALRLGGSVLGVLRYAPELDARAIVQQWREAFGDALAGLLINRRTRYAGHDVEDRLAPAIRATGVDILGVLPEERMMLAPTVRQVAEHLRAEFYTWASEDYRLVEQFIIGGLILEWGGNYFGRHPNQAVIVRGGRTDIAMSALNFPMSCLILTGCSEPPQYVYQRAGDQGVPLMVVSQGTIEVAASLETVHQRTSVHHPAKFERLADLLVGHLDWDLAYAAAGLPGAENPFRPSLLPPP